MWKCPKCETINNNDVCVICGENKPINAQSDQNFNAIDDSNKLLKTVLKDKKWLLFVIGIVLLIVFAIVLSWGILEMNYSNANESLHYGNYLNAKQIFSNIRFYRDSENMINECDYQEANSLLSKGEAQDAKAIFERISVYKDSSALIKECDYVTAVWHQESGELLKAFDELIDLGEYKDSKQQAEETKKQIYIKGIELYKNKEYSNSKDYFKKSKDIENAEKYLRLIEAHTTTIGDISTIYDLIDFEDTKEILKSSKYIETFMYDRWTNSSGKYIEYYKKDGDTSTWCKWNIPSNTGKHWKLEDGISYQGSDDSGWIKDWTIEIVGANTIRVYCHKDGSTHTLYR